MKARELVASATFEPEALSVIGQAFDMAWNEIVRNFGDNPAVVEAARVRLAHAILSVAKDDVRDPAELKVAALQVFALAYRLGGSE
jgi:hypothetical protein